MKITCLFKGLPRFYPQAISKLDSQLVIGASANVTSFSSFWIEGLDNSNSVNGKPLPLAFNSGLQSSLTSMSSFRSNMFIYVSPPKHVLGNYSSYLSNNFRELIPADTVNPYNICSSLLSFSYLFDSLDSYCKNIQAYPDICILLRPDMSFSSKLKILPSNVVDCVLNKNYIFLPRSGHHLGGVSDQLLIASFENMKRISSLWRYLPAYLSQGSLFHSENLLKTHIHSCNINIGIIDILTYIYRRGRPKHSGTDGILSDSEMSKYFHVNPF